MNAERLHIIAKRIQQDFNKTELIDKSQQTVDSLQSYVNNQQNANIEQQFSDNLSNLYEALNESEINEFSPAWMQIVTEIGGNELLGEELTKRIEGIFSRNQITPSMALEEYENIHEELNKFKDSIDNIVSSFSSLNIGEEDLDPGECELGILVPRVFVNNNLEEFSEELDELDFVVKNFEEISTGKREDLSIKTISSSDLMVFLDIVPKVGVCLAIAIERIITLYKKILEIRKLHSELEDQGIPEKNLEGVKKYSNSSMSSGINELADDIMDRFYEGNSNDRKNELKNELKITLNKIANRVDKGFNFEIRVEKEESDENDAEESSQDENFNIIQGASKELRFLNLSGSPILSLPEQTDEEE